jgi:hypothetical protein
MTYNDDDDDDDDNSDGGSNRYNNINDKFKFTKQTYQQYIWNSDLETWSEVTFLKT